MPPDTFLANLDSSLPKCRNSVAMWSLIQVRRVDYDMYTEIVSIIRLQTSFSKDQLTDGGSHAPVPCLR